MPSVAWLLHLAREMHGRALRQAGGDTAVADANQARRASGAWLASRSMPPEPAVAAFVAMDAMPDLASAPRADMRHWVQAETFLSGYFQLAAFTYNHSLFEPAVAVFYAMQAMPCLAGRQCADMCRWVEGVLYISWDAFPTISVCRLAFAAL